MMTDTDAVGTRATSVSSDSSFGVSAVLGMAWVLATIPVTQGSLDVAEATSLRQSEASMGTVEETFQVTSRDLVDALVNMRSRLEASSQPIEPEVKEVLYDNLWDLT